MDEIDFWSLDVEGGELEVLKQFDFSRVKVNTLVSILIGSTLLSIVPEEQYRSTISMLLYDLYN